MSFEHYNNIPFVNICFVVFLASDGCISIVGATMLIEGFLLPQCCFTPTVIIVFRSSSMPSHSQSWTHSPMLMSLMSPLVIFSVLLYGTFSWEKCFLLDFVQNSPSPPPQIQKKAFFSSGELPYAYKIHDLFQSFSRIIIMALLSFFVGRHRKTRMSVHKELEEVYIVFIPSHVSVCLVDACDSSQPHLKSILYYRQLKW